MQNKNEKHRIEHDVLSDWLTLAHAQGLGPRKLKQIRDILPSARDILDNIADLPLSPETKQQLKQPDQQYLHKALKWLEQSSQHHLIHLQSKNYPTALAVLPDPPILLYVIGNPNVLPYPQIAIVGSRRASPFGLKQAQQFSQALTRAGLCITSGLALGIDGAAHQGALAASGNTLAVLGSGYDQIYPKQHRALAKKITENGALVSEFSLSMPPLAENFPRRNRIISGLTLGTLVIEASLNSGSLITARLANDQGREVFAIPGSINHPLSAGVHHLIQQGAKLVTSTEDILEEIALTSNSDRITDAQFLSQKLDPTLSDLLECVDFAITMLDDIHKISKLCIKEVADQLLQLEIMGYIKKVSGGYIRVT